MFGRGCYLVGNVAAPKGRPRQSCDGGPWRGGMMRAESSKCGRYIVWGSARRKERALRAEHAPVGATVASVGAGGAGDAKRTGARLCYVHDDAECMNSSSKKRSLLISSLFTHSLVNTPPCTGPRARRGAPRGQARGAGAAGARPRAARPLWRVSRSSLSTLELSGFTTRRGSAPSSRVRCVCAVRRGVRR